MNNFVGYLHGDKDNELYGGSCAEFLKLNDLSQCCAEKEDECYLIHYDTRCYCDAFCNRPNSDCCPDALTVCDDNSFYSKIENKTATPNYVESTKLKSRISTKRETNTNKNEIQTSTETENQIKITTTVPLETFFEEEGYLK